MEGRISRVEGRESRVEALGFNSQSLCRRGMEEIAFPKRINGNFVPKTLCSLFHRVRNKSARRESTEETNHAISVTY